MIRKVEFIKSVYDIAALPDEGLPEVVFAGRSNVGKSSMINSLLCTNIARVSNTPGRTQSINYVLVNSMCLFVDLPGYGFSRTSPEMRAAWAVLIDGYFSTGRNIRAVVQVIDIRHEPKEKDMELFEYLKARKYRTVIACSKADKLSATAAAASMKLIRETLGPVPEYLVFSSKTGAGRERLLSLLIDACG